jgi:hypothetical protein
VALLLLEFGIGAHTAIFTLTDQILLLPVKNPGELVLFRDCGTRWRGERGKSAYAWRWARAAPMSWVW